jgi:hypothetical protein
LRSFISAVNYDKNSFLLPVFKGAGGGDKNVMVGW